jgi:hypothetical protein
VTVTLRTELLLGMGLVAEAEARCVDGAEVRRQHRVLGVRGVEDVQGVEEEHGALTSLPADCALQQQVEGHQSTAAAYTNMCVPDQWP